MQGRSDHFSRRPWVSWRCRWQDEALSECQHLIFQDIAQQWRLKSLETLELQAMAAASSSASAGADVADVADANVPVEELSLADRVAVLEGKVEDQAWLSRAERARITALGDDMMKMDRQLRDSVHKVDFREFRHCMHVSVKDLRNKLYKLQDNLTELKTTLEMMEANAGKSSGVCASDDGAGGRGVKRAAEQMVGEGGEEDDREPRLQEDAELATNNVLREIAVREGTYPPPS